MRNYHSACQYQLALSMVALRYCDRFNLDQRDDPKISQSKHLHSRSTNFDNNIKSSQY